MYLISPLFLNTLIEVKYIWTNLLLPNVRPKPTVVKVAQQKRMRTRNISSESEDIRKVDIPSKGSSPKRKSSRSRSRSPKRGDETLKTKRKKKKIKKKKIKSNTT